MLLNTNAYDDLSAQHYTQEEWKLHISAVVINHFQACLMMAIEFSRNI
jgi:hypothetical protein